MRKNIVRAADYALHDRPQPAAARLIENDSKRGLVLVGPMFDEMKAFRDSSEASFELFCGRRVSELEIA